MKAHWRAMNKFEKIQAIEDAYFHGCFAKDIAAKIDGATRSKIISFYKRHRSALEGCPLGVKGLPEAAILPSDPVITAGQMPKLVQMRKDGATLEQLATEADTTISSVRRAFERYGASLKPAPRNRVTPAPEEPSRTMERYKARISDEPYTLMDRLILEGPSPERRRLMEEGLI